MKYSKKIFIFLIIIVSIIFISVNVKAEDSESSGGNAGKQIVPGAKGKVNDGGSGNNNNNNDNNDNGGNNSGDNQPKEETDPEIPEPQKFNTQTCQDTINNIAKNYGIGVKYYSNSGTNLTPQLLIYMGYNNSDGNLVEDPTTKTNATFRISEIIVSDIPIETTKLVTYRDFKNNKSLLKNYAEYSNYKNYKLCRYYFCGTDYQKRNLSSVFNLYNTNLGYKGKITINVLRRGRSNDFIPTRYYIVLESKAKDTILRQKCGADIISNPVIMIDVPGKAVSKYEYTPPPPQPIQTNGMIDCDKKHPDNSFEKSFCDVWNLKDKGVKVRQFSKETPDYASYVRNGGEKVSAFTCDPFIFDVKSDEFKYTNTGYLLGQTSMEIEVGKYVYKLGGQYLDKPGQTTEKSFVKGKYKALDEKKEYDADDLALYNEVKAAKVEMESIKCKIQCREVVTIEYGSPIISKAGFCFEYNVKVTSRVNCQSEAPNRPKAVATCYPIPVCNHCGQNDRFIAAGPNQEFDSCINSCDGGKYSIQCSKSCYNKVYGGKGFSNTNSFIDDLVATKLADGERPSTGWPTPTKDDYYYIKNGQIFWYNSSKTLGRWYFNNSTSFLGHPCSFGGAAALCNCCATCWWEGCNTNQYLNEGEASRDGKYNEAQYHAAVKACSQYSKCSTSQATFTISTNYYYGSENTLSTLKFPTNSSKNNDLKDTIQYQNGTVVCSKEEGKSTLLTPVIENNQNHCYNCGEQNVDSEASSSRMYVAEWGFPGYYFSAKSQGDTFYTRGPGYTLIPRKVCIPRQANNINQKWFNNFVCTALKSDNYSYNDTIKSIVEDTINNNFDMNQCNKTPTKEELNTIYNIEAKSENFGLFGWDIDVKCFYALNSNIVSEFKKFDDDDDDDDDDDETSKYQIRSVELTNLFPATDGGSISTSDSSGRQPGFNWTTYAKNDKTTDFTSDPVAYKNFVQRIGNDIYSDEYLDYDIILTKDDIYKLRNLKKRMKGFNDLGSIESNDDGRFINNSVTNYRSSLFRHTNKDPILSAFTVPDEDVLKCNNILDDNSCFIAGKDG